MDLLSLLILLPILILSLAVHEFAHAFVADKLGDPTPRFMGRVTLNPLKHLDTMGTAILVFTAFLSYRTNGQTPAFGWGKPVIFNPANLKYPKRDVGIVAIAGPISNIILATLGIITMALSANLLGVIPFFQVFIQFIVINVILAVFNMIPIYPLDGFNVVVAILPNSLSEQFKETARYGTIVLLLLIFTNSISTILTPVVNTVLVIIRVIV